MTVLSDKSKKTIAYIYHNAILQPDTLLVTGLILGHCVYGLRGFARGKFFHHALYNKSGEIVATTGKGELPEELDPTIVLYQAWQILGKIKEYDFPWVEPMQQWSSQDLQTFLL